MTIIVEFGISANSTKLGKISPEVGKMASYSCGEFGSYWKKGTDFPKRLGSPIVKLLAFRSFRVLGVALISSAISGCSPGAFFGGSKDPRVANTPNYRKINTECASMNLSSPKMDAVTVKALITCLNAYGGIEPIAKLVNGMETADLEVLIEVTNRYYLDDRRTLFEIDRTYSALESKQLLAPALVQLGRLLENSELIVHGLTLLKAAYFTSYTRSVHPKLLKTLERLSARLNPEHLVQAMDAGLSLGGAQVFSDLQSHFKSENQSLTDVRKFSDPLLDYLKGTGNARGFPAGRKLIEHALEGELFPALDNYFGTTESLRTSIPQMSGYLRNSLANDARLMKGVNSLYHYLHKGPISCVRGTQSIPDVVMFFMSELLERNYDPSDPARALESSFVKRSHPLIAAATAGLCEFPPELSTYYPALFEMADGGYLGVVTDLLYAFYTVPGKAGRGSRPMIQFAVDFLSDTGTGEQENRAGVMHLIPLLKKLDDREAFNDLLLTANLLRVEDRRSLLEALDFVSKKVPELGGQSVYDVLADGMSRVGMDLFAKTLFSLRHYVNANDALLVPALTALRSAYYVNDAHPFLNPMQRLLSHASDNQKLFDILFNLVDKPEFLQTLQLVSEMGRDGRMKDLLGVGVTLFHPFAMQGQGNPEIQLLTEPKHEPKRRHEFTSKDLKPFVPLPPELRIDPTLVVCSHIDLRMGMDDFLNPGYEQQISSMVGCMNHNGLLADVAESVDFLRHKKTESGESYFTYTIDLLKKLQPEDRTSFGFVTSALIDAINTGDLFHVLNAYTFWVDRNISLPGPPPTIGPVLRPLLDLSKPLLLSARSELGRLSRLGGEIVSRDDLPPILRYVEKIADLKPEPPVKPPVTGFPIAEIKDWITRNECKESGQEARAHEIVDEYVNTVTNWDLVGGMPRRSFTFGEFKDTLENALRRLALPHALKPGQYVYDAVLKVQQYFTLKPGSPPNQDQHYPQARLEEWIRQRADDYRLITYFYPGDQAPRVRLASTLDRLELILIDADFAAPVLGTNFGIKFLGDFAEAWGDEPREVWPSEIKKQYPEGSKKRPPLLMDVVNSIKRTQSLFEVLVGFPTLPSCMEKPKQVEFPMGGSSPKEIKAWILSNFGFEIDLGDPSEIHNVKDGYAFLKSNFGKIKNQLHGIGKLLTDKAGAHEVKSHIYNLHQVLPVLEENAPSSGTVHLDGGLKVVRDLSYEIKYSTPPEFQGSKDEENNLQIVLKLVRLGFFRQLGKQMREMTPGDPAVTAFFESVIRGSTSFYTSPLLKEVLVADPERQLFWKIVENVFKIFDDPSPDGKRDGDFMKQTAFYGVNVGSQLDLIDHILFSITPILQRDRDYLLKYPARIEELLRSRDSAYFIRALWEDGGVGQKGMLSDLLQSVLMDPQNGLDALTIVKTLDLDPGAHQSWDWFVQRKDALMGQPDYQPLKPHIKRIGRQLVDFFEERSANPDARRAARDVRRKFAERLQQRDFEQLLVLAKENPNEFYRVLTMVSRRNTSGDLREIFQLLSRGLSEQQ